MSVEIQKNSRNTKSSSEHTIFFTLKTSFEIISGSSAKKRVKYYSALYIRFEKCQFCCLKCKILEVMPLKVVNFNVIKQ